MKDDKKILINEFKRLGAEDFKRLYRLINTNCISELGLGDCTNCERTPQDNADDYCLNCLVNTLEKVVKEEHSIFKFKRK